jgi:hypothetical protein
MGTDKKPRAYMHPTPKHNQEAVRKLERYNQDQGFAPCESALTSFTASSSLAPYPARLRLQMPGKHDAI